MNGSNPASQTKIYGNFICTNFVQFVMDSAVTARLFGQKTRSSDSTTRGDVNRQAHQKSMRFWVLRTRKEVLPVKVKIESQQAKL